MIEILVQVDDNHVPAVIEKKIRKELDNFSFDEPAYFSQLIRLIRNIDGVSTVKILPEIESGKIPQDMNKDIKLIFI